MLQKYLECARVTSTHGVRGTLRLECRADSPKTLTRVPKMYILDKEKNVIKTLTLSHASVQKNMVLATFAEIATLEEAIPYRDTVLYADRKDIPLAPGAHFIADLIGLPVMDERFGNVGVLTEVLSPAGQDIYVVKRENGSTFMFPCVSEFVKEISLGEEKDNRAAGIYVHLIDGFLEDTNAN